jgi:hypothetical protein
MTHTYGAVPSPPDSRDYKAVDHVAMGKRPKEYMPPVLAPVLNQGFVPSCVAHALSLLKTYQEHKERGIMQLYSTDFIYWNRQESDYHGQGMIIREALSNLCKDGTPPKEALPGNYGYVKDYRHTYLTDKIRELAKPQVIKKYAVCYNDSEVCDCIYQNGPVVLGVGVYDSFDILMDWKVPEPKPTEQRNGVHAITAIGYNSEGIIIQNSWGEYWGKGGLALLPYDYSPITERWIVVDKVSEWDTIELWIGDKRYRRNGIEGALDVPPEIKDGRTLVPIRFIGESLGASVEYDDKAKKITIRRERD